MKLTKILCPIDFSACSEAALQHAVDLAGFSGAELIMVHVMAPPPTYISGYAGYGALPPYEPAPDPRLEEAQVSDPTVKVQRVHLVGLEGEAIVKYAQQNGCDLIVMGTHGYQALAKFFLGSVADYVLRHAKCRVVVVKDKQFEAQAVGTD